jgi:2-polyprenyl-3-methyl-5-hydroxy-6-metoxy-1,4-benzoquinol methylase
MFFGHLIRSIPPQARVLDVGPGGTPHPRATVLLERNFDAAEAAAQRGHAPMAESEKEIVYFDGGRFPFADGAFDYVICSHVLEHVEDVPAFVGELTRVAPRGYLEFPTILYEYLYNFRVHQNFLLYIAGEIRWMRKAATAIDAFSPAQDFLRRSLCAGYDETVTSLKEQFFQGFEWTAPLATREVTTLGDLAPATEAFVFPANPLKAPPMGGKELLRELLRRARRRLFA